VLGAGAGGAADAAAAVMLPLLPLTFPGQVSEECFQKGSLEFASEMSALVYPNGTKRAFKVRFAYEILL